MLSFGRFKRWAAFSCFTRRTLAAHEVQLHRWSCSKAIGKTDSSWMTLNLGVNHRLSLWKASYPVYQECWGLGCRQLLEEISAHQFEVQKTHQKWSNISTMLAVPQLKQEELVTCQIISNLQSILPKAATLHSSYHYPLPINALVMLRCDLCQICHYGTLEFDL